MKKNKIYHDKPKNIIPGDQIKIVDIINASTFGHPIELTETHRYFDEDYYDKEFLISICSPFSEDVCNFIKIKGL